MKVNVITPQPYEDQDYDKVSTHKKILISHMEPGWDPNREKEIISPDLNSMPQVGLKFEHGLIFLWSESET